MTSKPKVPTDKNDKTVTKTAALKTLPPKQQARPIQLPPHMLNAQKMGGTFQARKSPPKR